jgi:23S rRNA-/tRNA-specific pseudouridylate synthase
LIAAQQEFAAGRARKTYWAVVRGALSHSRGTVDAPLLRQSTLKGWRMVVDPTGKPAVTDWRILGTVGKLIWLELSPRTGRTHQVRVHCSVLGCPILGDPVYGDAGGPLHLLARSIALDLDPPITATAPVPEHMQAMLKRFRPGTD